MSNLLQLSDISSVFFKKMQEGGAFEKKPALAVAVSGGSDSLALALLANEWVKAHQGTLVALTVDHQLRSESTEEAKKVGEWMRTHAIPHVILTWTPPNAMHNIQANAREARYALLTEWCERHHMLHLLLGHHADDQRDTFLLRLERGSGVQGLSGMSLVHWHKRVRLLRPLLPLTKQQLKSYLLSKKQEWVEDPSNDKALYGRNRVRAFFETYKPVSVDVDKETVFKRITESMSHLKDAAEIMEQEKVRHMAQMVRIFPEGYAEIETSIFSALHREEALRCLSALLTTIAGSDYPPRFLHLEELYMTWISNGVAFKRTLGGCICERRVNSATVCITREPAAIQETLEYVGPHLWRWDRRFLIQYKDSADSMPAYYVWRRMRTTDKSSLEEQKTQGRRWHLPSSILMTLPVLSSLDSVLAVPHIGVYRDPHIKGAFDIQFSPMRALTSLS